MVGICILLCFWLVDWIELLCREMLMCRLIDREFNFAQKYLKLYWFYDHGENLKRIPVPRFIEKMECDAHQIIPRLHWLDGWTLQRVEMVKVKLFIFSLEGFDVLHFTMWSWLMTWKMKLWSTENENLTKNGENKFFRNMKAKLFLKLICVITQ